MFNAMQARIGCLAAVVHNSATTCRGFLGLLLRGDLKYSIEDE